MVVKEDFNKERYSKTIDKSETQREDASDKFKDFIEKITQDSNSRKHSNISKYKNAENEEIRMRGKVKENMEETPNLNNRCINEVFTSTPHIRTQEEHQTEYLAEDMNISFDRALENKQHQVYSFAKYFQKIKW